MRDVAASERGVHREDLVAVDGGDGSRLRDLVAADDLRDADVEHRGRTRAYDRYWPVAQTSGRPVACSSASTHAPSPAPPKSAPSPEHSEGTTGRRQWRGIGGRLHAEEGDGVHEAAEPTVRESAGSLEALERTRTWEHRESRPR